MNKSSKKNSYEYFNGQTHELLAIKRFAYGSKTKRFILNENRHTQKKTWRIMVLLRKIDVTQVKVVVGSDVYIVILYN